MNLSFLNTYDSLESAILDLSSCSKSRLKKHLNKKYLKKSVDAKQSFDVSINVLNHLEINPIYEGPDIRIIFENEDFIAINKPNDIHCQPHSYDESDNCLSYLRSIGKLGPLHVNTNNYDRGLLYRLDYETSGVLVFTKNEALYNLVREKKDFISKKIYTCLVSGKFETMGEINLFFKASGKSGNHMMVSDEHLPGHTNGKLIITEIEYSSRNNSSKVTIELSTGLRHQIRATMGHLGSPIMGDVKYGANESDRLYLHAREYQVGDVMFSVGEVF